jgi:hypothetical protein
VSVYSGTLSVCAQRTACYRVSPSSLVSHSQDATRRKTRQRTTGLNSRTVPIAIRTIGGDLRCVAAWFLTTPVTRGKNSLSDFDPDSADLTYTVKSRDAQPFGRVQFLWTSERRIRYTDRVNIRVVERD